jgi:hypothetical protein
MSVSTRTRHEIVPVFRRGHYGSCLLLASLLGTTYLWAPGAVAQQGFTIGGLNGQSAVCTTNDGRIISVLDSPDGCIPNGNALSNGTLKADDGVGGVVTVNTSGSGNIVA